MASGPAQLVRELLASQAIGVGHGQAAMVERAEPLQHQLATGSTEWALSSGGDVREIAGLTFALVGPDPLTVPGDWVFGDRAVLPVLGCETVLVAQGF